MNQLYDQYYVKPCPSSKMCPESNDLAPRSCTALFNNAYPGTKCNFENSCKSPSVCTKGVCKGKAKDESCISNEECDPGLYCSAGKCASQQKEGGVCAKLGDCENTLICGDNQKCVKLLHVSNGDDCKGDYNCKDGFCYSGKCYTKESAHDAPHKCTTQSSTSDECVSKKHHGIFTSGVCACGRNPNGDLYCSQMPYDYYGKKYFGKLRDIRDESYLSKCNISVEDDGLDACVRSYADKDDLEEYLYYKQQYKNYAEFLGAESCVTDTYYPQFEDLDDDYAEDSDFGAVLILPLFFGLI